MRKRKIKSALALALSLLMLASGPVGWVWAQDSSADPMLRLYVDPATHIVYTEPGRGRHLLATIPSSALAGGGATAELERRQDRTDQELQEDHAQMSELLQKNQQLEAQNADFQTQMAEIRPAWRSYIDNFQDKFRVGTLVYGDYRFYTHTGFQPQELTQVYNPGVGNNYWNAFDITRTYLNFFFFPTRDWILRITPNMYKTVGNTNDHVGTNTAYIGDEDGDLGVRIKYAYLQYKDLWQNFEPMKDDTVTIGEGPNPLVGWEEDLYGFRYVNLTPWNYLSLSSTQLGISTQGPVKFNGLTYLDYDFGVYNNASFHAFENTNTKEAMGRATIYPFGADWRFQGLGLTGFYNYGYGNTTPDAAQVPTTLKGGNARIERIAALIHYESAQWGLAGEFDYGNNAFSASNFWSGSAPADAEGFVTGPSVTKSSILTGFNPSCVAGHPCYSLYNSFGPSTNATEAILNNGQARQVGFDMFGHFHIPNTPLTAFGMYQWLLPNDKFGTAGIPDPLDFQRFIVGVSWQINEFLRFAIDSQNILFYHNQESIPVSYLKQFGYIPGSSFNGLLLPSTGSIPYMVQRDTHSIWGNFEFSY
ncbi:MAG TPA: hypothetical protein VMF50_07595 [Candidatus Binataceae bacterium]|nr:hypothetical protein [Candidatus Binataceae bacterium]